MRWVTCFAARHDSGGNIDMLQVAIATAIERTSLQPTVVLDDPDDLVRPWIESRGVEIVSWRSRWCDRIDACPERQDRRDRCSAFAPGTMIRLELADIAAEHGWTEQRLFYADHDVWFRSDPVPLLPDARTAIAACTEMPGFDGMFNAGVLLIDLPRYRDAWPSIADYVETNLDTLMSNRARFGGVDQATLNWAFRDRWHRMPQTLNAMPWWGDEVFDAGVLIHMHGLKPHDRDDIAAGKVPQTMLQTAGGAFERACEEWEALAAEISDSTLATPRRG